MTDAVAARLLVLIPIFEDWAAAGLLLPDLDRALDAAGLRATVWLVDDGSNEPAPMALGSPPYRAIESVEVLALRRNLGHQRAIAIGLAAAHERFHPSAVVVMDGDGQDAPDEVPQLVAALEQRGGRPVIFAERRRRSESLLFQLFYQTYRFGHLLLTGIAVRVGNFSIVPAAQLDRLVVVSELWNHYSAAVFTSKVPYDMIPTRRRNRLSGETRMNFTALVSHGMSALSVHAELVGVRLLVVTALLATMLLIAFGTRLAALGAVSGWAGAAAGLVVLFLAQTVATVVIFVFLVLHGRSQPLFVPLRDYSYFVADLKTLSPAAVASTRDRPA